MHLVQMSEGLRREDAIRKTAWQDTDTRICPLGEKVLAKHISTDATNRLNPRYRLRIWFGVRNNNAECIIGTADVVFRTL